jgi:hypothetical protein
MNTPPKMCVKCGSACVCSTGRKTWRCAECNHRMRIKASGPKNTPENLIYHAMMHRCYDASDKAYSRYGGRGITVCERWRTDWRTFVKDVGLRPTSFHVLDRTDNDGNYEPGNVHWVTRKESTDNRACTIWITHEGKRQSLAAWAREVGMDIRTLGTRVRRGWDFAEAIRRPIAHKAVSH